MKRPRRVRRPRGYRGRRADRPSNSELGVYTDEQLEFMLAIEGARRALKVLRPSDSQLFCIALAKGYRKVAEEGPVKLALGWEH